MLPDRQNLSSYHQALGGLKRGLLVAAALSAVISVLMLTGSIYMLQVYDRVLSSGSGATLMALFGIVVVLYAFLTLYDALRMRLMSRLSLGLDERLAQTAFQADLAGLSNAGHGQRRGSTAYVQDLETVRGFIAGPAMLALFDLPFTVVFLAALFLIHPALGWITMGGMGVAAGLAAINRLVLVGPMAATAMADAETRRLAEQARRVSPMLTALGMSGQITTRWLLLHRRALAVQQCGNEPSELLTALSRSLRMLLQAILLSVGAWLTIRGSISSGSIVAASILSGRALGPVDQLIGQWRSVAAAMLAHKSLGENLTKGKAHETMSLPPFSGALELQNVTALAQAPEGHADRRAILDGISFQLSPGDGLGIVGASASGKSTLARLIVGALSADSGEIRFDGATTQNWPEGMLNRQIGYLPQRIDLLPGSLRDNIARFDPMATDQDVIAAAEAAGVHDMILHLPNAYATDLSQADIPLSGGQIQRIGLARALFGGPRLLVLDEPNAHLDLAGEATLVRTLMDLRAKGVTIIVLAHRAGALAAVDRLMVLQEGRIAQDGPRDDVLTVLGAPKRSDAALSDVSVKVPAKTALRITLPKSAKADLTATGPQAVPAPAPDSPPERLLFRAHSRKSA